MKKGIKIIVGILLIVGGINSHLSKPSLSSQSAQQGEIVGQITAKITFIAVGIYLVFSGIRQKSQKSTPEKSKQGQGSVS